MCGTVYQRGEYTWVHDVRGDFVCIHDGYQVATIFSTRWEPWQIILHMKRNSGIMKHERFSNPQAAMSRVEELLEGTRLDGFAALKPEAFSETFCE
jgi:hypothetical protein